MLNLLSIAGIVNSKFDLFPIRHREVRSRESNLSGVDVLVYLYLVTHDAPDFSTLPHKCCAAAHHRV